MCAGFFSITLLKIRGTYKPKITLVHMHHGIADTCLFITLVNLVTF